jgi:hypothetical protein
VTDSYDATHEDTTGAVPSGTSARQQRHQDLEPSEADTLWLRSALAQVAGDPPPTTHLEALRELATARRAVRRHRGIQGIIAFAAAAAVLVPTVGLLGSSNSSPDLSAASSAAPTLPTAAATPVAEGWDTRGPAPSTGASSPSLKQGPHAEAPTPGRPLPAAAASSSTTSSRSTPPELVLQPDGLELSSGGTTVERLQFRSSVMKLVRETVTSALGPLTLEQLANCSQGRRTRLVNDHVSLLFDGTQFVGWSDDSGANPRIATAEGVRVGTSLADLQQALPGVEVYSDALGPHWRTPDGLAGSLQGTAPTSRVTEIHGGEACLPT